MDGPGGVGEGTFALLHLHTPSLLQLFLCIIIIMVLKIHDFTKVVTMLLYGEHVYANMCHTPATFDLHLHGLGV